MNCDECARWLGEAIDGTLPADREAAVRDHGRRCPHCGPLLTDLGEIRAVAATLERHPVRQEIWSRIAVQIEAGAGRRRLPAAGWWQGLAAAAALAMLVATALWFDSARQPARNAATTTQADLARNAATELQQAEAHYANAIAALEQLTADGTGALDPLVAEEITRSLTTIDLAIGDTRAALTEEPGSLVAQASLLEALRMKVALLQQTVSLIGEAERGTTPESPKS